MPSYSFAIPHSAQPSMPCAWNGAAIAALSLRHEPGRCRCSEGVPLVFVVEDDPAARLSLEHVLGTAGCRTEGFACADDFLACPRRPGPACLVLDVSLPDANGLDLQQRLVEDGSLLPIVMVGGEDDVSTAVRAMKAGAIDYVTKPVDPQELLRAVAHAIERSRAALHEATELSQLRQRFATLTRREREVLERVVAGRLNKQIAADLAISEITVKAHRGRMMQKMAAGSLPELVRMAARLSTIVG